MNGGWYEEIDGVKILHVSGTYYDMGYQHGYLLKDIANFKILLSCPLETRIKRMAERDQTTYEEKLKETLLREKSERERFKILYNIDLEDEEKAEGVYDFIINTKDLTVEEVIEKILTEIKKL